MTARLEEKFITLLRAAVASLLCVGSDLSAREPVPLSTRLIIDYSPTPDALELSKRDWCILDPGAQVDLSRIRQSGQTFLCYISAVEVSKGSPAAKAAAARGVPVVARNGDWNSDVLDITHPQWLPLMLEALAPDAIARGFDGFFLDTLDSVELIEASHPGRKAACHTALRELVEGLRKRFPKARIVLNRGFDVVPDVADCIDGVLIEGLYRSWKPGSKNFCEVPPRDTDWLMTRIKDFQTRKLPLFIVDYVSPADRDLAARTASRIAALGCIALVTTPDLHGKVLAPPPIR